MCKNSYFPGQNSNITKDAHLLQENVDNTKSVKRSNKNSNSFLKKSADNALENKVTSVVKSSKLGGATDEEETAHFVFFDMED